MKLEFKKDALLNGINIVSKAIPSRTTMSILECILIDADASEIKLTGNDMELGIETKVEGSILERGKIALEAKLFTKLSENYRMARPRLSLLQTIVLIPSLNVRMQYSIFRAVTARNFPIFRILNVTSTSV